MSTLPTVNVGAAGESDENFRGIADDMIVREDQPLGIDNDSRTVTIRHGIGIAQIQSPKQFAGSEVAHLMKVLTVKGAEFPRLIGGGLLPIFSVAITAGNRDAGNRRFGFFDESVDLRLKQLNLAILDLLRKD